jgi:flavin-dependent dehydrogenase
MRADVVVVGAGSSGAAAAAMFAERGMRVICLERKALDRAGARWVNGVPRAAFVDAGVALPGPDESDGQPAPFHLVATSGRALVPAHDVIDVDMRKLVARLQARAAAAGAELRAGVSVSARDGDRVVTSAGSITARWMVDASGLAGARLLDQPAVAREDLCAAAQQVHEVTDRAAAVEYFAGHGVAPGEVLGLIGVAGGYSVLNVRLHHGGATMGVLTGSIPSLGFASGKAMLDEFVASQPWIGARVFGGSGAIPLRRAHDRLADDRVALIGDAGCQVFPAHGSGVGSGLLAARLLADTLAGGGSLRDYEVAWQRRHGGVFAFFDVFRRWNQAVDADTLGRVMGLGLVDAETLRAGIDQVLPRPTVAAVAAKARVLLGQPRLAAAIASTAARSIAVRALYKRYPRRPERVAAWARGVDWLLGS